MVGEFQEFGFAVRADLRDNVTDAELDAFFDRWIDLVESRRLTFGGGSSEGNVQGFVARDGRGSTTDEDRNALGKFLSTDAAIVHHEIGDLVDAWR